MAEENNEILNHLFKDQVNPDTDEFDIVFVLDRSGSMASIRNDVIGGTNTFIEEQKREGGSAFISLIQFDTEYGDPAYWRKPLSEVEPLTNMTFIPRGMTALFDAIGRTVAKIREMRATGEITGKVQFVIQTDGHENSSREFTTRESVAELIKQVTDEGWGDFIFLGTNIDAFAGGGSFGVNAARTVNYANNAGGTLGASYFASATTKSFRYGDALDDDEIRVMQESVAIGSDFEDLYKEIDAKIDRSGKKIDPIDI